MITITIVSNNDVTRNVALEEINANGNTVTYKDVLGIQDVIDFFDADPQDLEENLVSVNGNDIPTAFKAAVLSSAVQEGDVLEFDLEVEEPEEDLEEEETEETEQAPAPNQTGRPGKVAVYVSVVDVTLDIVNGRTTLHDCVYNDAIRSRTAMNDTQLSNQTLTLNGQEVAPSAWSTRVVVNGDVIRLNPRYAKTGGNM